VHYRNENPGSAYAIRHFIADAFTCYFDENNSNYS